MTYSGTMGTYGDGVWLYGQFYPAGSPQYIAWVNQTYFSTPSNPSGSPVGQPSNSTPPPAPAPAAPTSPRPIPAQQNLPINTPWATPQDIKAEIASGAFFFRPPTGTEMTPGERRQRLDAQRRQRDQEAEANRVTGNERLSTGEIVTDAAVVSPGNIRYEAYDPLTGQGSQSETRRATQLNDRDRRIIQAYVDGHPDATPLQRSADEPAGNGITIGMGFAGGVTDQDRKAIDAANAPMTPTQQGDLSGFVPLVGFSSDQSRGTAPVAIVNPFVHVAPATEAGFGEASTEENARLGRYLAMDIHGTSLDFGYYKPETRTFYYFYKPSTYQGAGEGNPHDLGELIGYTRQGSAFSNVQQGPEKILEAEIQRWVMESPENISAYNKAFPEYAIKPSVGRDGNFLTQQNVLGIPNSIADTPQAQAVRAAMAPVAPTRPAPGFLGMQQDLEAINGMLHEYIEKPVSDVAPRLFAGAPFPQAGKDFFIDVITGAAETPGIITGTIAGFIGANRAIARTADKNPAAVPELIATGAYGVAAGTFRAATENPVKFVTQMVLLDLLGGGGLTKGVTRGIGGAARAVVEDWRSPEGFLHQSPGELANRVYLAGKARASQISVYNKLPNGEIEITGPEANPTGMNYQYPGESVFSPRSVLTDDIYRPTQIGQIKGAPGSLFDEYIIKRPVDIEYLRNFEPAAEQAEYASRVNSMPKTGEGQFIESYRGGAGEPLVSRELGITISAAGKGARALTQEDFAAQVDRWSNYYAGVPADLLTDKAVSILERITPSFEDEIAQANGLTSSFAFANLSTGRQTHTNIVNPAINNFSLESIDAATSSLTFDIPALRSRQDNDQSSLIMPIMKNGTTQKTDQTQKEKTRERTAEALLRPMIEMSGYQEPPSRRKIRLGISDDIEGPISSRRKSSIAGAAHRNPLATPAELMDILGTGTGAASKRMDDLMKGKKQR